MEVKLKKKLIFLFSFSVNLLKLYLFFSPEKLQSIARFLNLIPPESDNEVGNSYRKDAHFLLELLISRHERRTSQLESLNEMPLYPTESIIWNENVVPSEYFSGEGCLALPKLNLQFLTLHDYLLRNFNLFRLESTCKFPFKRNIGFIIIFK